MKDIEIANKLIEAVKEAGYEDYTLSYTTALNGPVVWRDGGWELSINEDPASMLSVEVEWSKETEMFYCPEVDEYGSDLKILVRKAFDILNQMEYDFN